MRLKISLGVTAMAAALALAAPAAHALTPAQPAVGFQTLTYSAQTMKTNGDAVALPPITYTNTEFMPNGTTIVFTASPGTGFAGFATGYSSVPFTAASGAGAPAGQPTETPNTGICNGAGNATTVSTSALTIVCRINAGTSITQNLGAPGTPPPGTSTNASVVFGVPAGIAVILRGVNNASPFTLTGLAALDNATTLVNTTGVGAALGAASLPTAAILAQASPPTAPLNGLVNGVTPNASNLLLPKPLGNGLAGVPPAGGFGSVGTTLPTANTAIGDPTAVPFVVIRAANMVGAVLDGVTLRIDLSTAGAATQFKNSSPAAVGGISKAGFLGLLGLNQVNGLLDAATGLAINSQTSNFTNVGGPRFSTGVVAGSPSNQNVQTSPANQPPCNTTTNAVVNCGEPTVNVRASNSLIENLINSTVNVTITGNFPSIAFGGIAYALQGGNANSCTPALPGGGGAIAATVTATTIQVSLPAPGSQAATALGSLAGPLTNQGSNSNVEYAICLVSNPTAVIQPTAAANTMQAPPNQMSNLNGITISASLGSAPNAFPLIAGNQAFGSIQFDGAAYYFENVFGVANLYPSFFRLINQSATPATVVAIVTKDTLVGSPTSAFGAVAGTGPFVGAATQTVPQPGIPGLSPGGSVTSVTSGPIAALPANNATYITADQVAASVGLQLTAGNPKATVWLISTNNAFRASMVAQSLATGDLINLQ